MKNATIWMLAAMSIFTLISVSKDLGAQDLKQRDTSSRGMERFAVLVKGTEVTRQGERYVFLPEVRAVRQVGTFENPQLVLSSLGVEGDEVLGTKGGFIIYKATGGPAQPVPALATLNDGTVYPVVLNQRTGQLGIVSGMIAVKLPEMMDGDAVAQDHGIQLQSRYDHLGLAFYIVSIGEDVLSAAQALAADARVDSAEVEILEHFHVPH